MITKELEKRWLRGSALPIYWNKADAIQIDKFVAKLVKDDTRLFPEFGCGKEAVLETVLNKIREQRRQQKEKYLTSKEGLSTDSASESTESAESSSWNPIPPTYTYQLQRVQKAYNLYFNDDVGITEVITANYWLPVFFLDLEIQKLYLKAKVNFVMFSNLNVGWVCKTWFQEYDGGQKMSMKSHCKFKGGGKFEGKFDVWTGISGRVWRFKPKTFLERGMDIS